MVYTFAKNLLE